MKLMAPKKCPFCGSPQQGGMERSTYYTCGAHVWIRKDGYGYPGEGDWHLFGHSGACAGIVKKGEGVTP